MKTRIVDLGPGRGRFSFQYTEHKHPLPHQWHCVGVTCDGTFVASAAQLEAAHRASWPSAWKRDQARACFTHRRTVEAALADLARAGLRPNTTTEGQR